MALSVISILLFAAQSGPESLKDERDVRKLLPDLEADDAAVRERASRALVTMGGPAWVCDGTRLDRFEEKKRSELDPAVIDAPLDEQKQEGAER